ncbi:hypothetical protein D1007_25449 [Hordeum vulgare]|nr:hypothetical protein D1007_25449 [Hordeum vulgare]
MGFRASTDSLALVEVEQSLEQERLEMRERQVSLGEESLTSREAELQERIEKGVAEAQRSLLLDYHAKLRLQEYRFIEHRGHLKNEVNALRKRLDQEVKQEASEEAVRARDLQLERSRTFQSLERKASRALSDIYAKSVSSSLVPYDDGYLGFFLCVLEHLEVGAAKALALADEKSHDLLSQAASDVFSHLLRLDPDFDFAPVLETICVALLMRSLHMRCA